MDSHFPQDWRPGSHPFEHPPRRKQRLRLRAGDQVIVVDRVWKDGLAVADSAPKISRGYVDLFDGAQHLAHGLIYQTGEAGGERTYAFKMSRKADLSQPADFERSESAPVALIPVLRRILTLHPAG